MVLVEGHLVITMESWPSCNISLKRRAVGRKLTGAQERPAVILTPLLSIDRPAQYSNALHLDLTTAKTLSNRNCSAPL